MPSSLLLLFFQAYLADRDVLPDYVTGPELEKLVKAQVQEYRKLGEEFGLVGICALLLIYLLLIGRGLVITAQAQTLFGKLLAGALTMTFFVYVFVNIGMVSGLLPVVGVPLPFISYGGTSLVTLLSAFGVLMSIHTHRKWIAQV